MDDGLAIILWVLSVIVFSAFWRDLASGVNKIIKLLEKDKQ